MSCVECGEPVGVGARFCSVCGQAVQYPAITPPPPRAIARVPSAGGLYRPREGRMIAGVCRGFAVRYGWDVAIVRLVLLLALIFGAGTPVLAYLIAWVVMPNGQLALPARASGGEAGSMRV